MVIINIRKEDLRMKFDRMHSLLCESEQRLNTDQIALLEYHFFIQNLDTFNENVLNEGVKDKVMGFLKKAKLSAKDLTHHLGIHIGKSGGRGLIQSLLASGMNISKVMIAAFQAVRGGDEEKAALKDAITKLKVKKEDLLDFLLRLDQATLHLVTGPLHMIDAIMGWHIWADVKAQASNISTRVKDAFTAMIQTIKDLPKKVKTVATSNMTDLRDTLMTGGFNF